MPTIRCDDINAIYWAWVGEYARRRKMDRCKALETIIEEHMKFTARAHTAKIKEAENAGKAKKK